MPIPANRRALKNQFDELPPKIREYLKELPQLLSADFSLDVSLAYVFAHIELAHNMTLANLDTALNAELGVSLEEQRRSA